MAEGQLQRAVAGRRTGQEGEHGDIHLPQAFQGGNDPQPFAVSRRLRLYEAQRLMPAENEDAAVAALAVGYESPTQFNREYKRWKLIIVPRAMRKWGFSKPVKTPNLIVYAPSLGNSASLTPKSDGGVAIIERLLE